MTFSKISSSLKEKGRENMTNIRDKLNNWNTTYSEAFEDRVKSGAYPSGKAVEIANYVIDSQHLSNKPMDGNSTTKMNVMEREIGDFKYVNVFNSITKRDDWSPVDMIYGTCYLANKDPNVSIMATRFGVSKEELISKMCGRALRALPSYMREHDLKEQLEKRLPHAKFKQNQALDTILHADLKMEYKGNDYYFWSFVNTERSIANFEHKFLGNRAGHVPDGIHIICPFDLERCETINGWKLYDNFTISSIARMTDNPIQANYKDVPDILRNKKNFFVHLMQNVMIKTIKKKNLL